MKNSSIRDSSYDLGLPEWAVKLLSALGLVVPTPVPVRVPTRT